MLAGNNVSVGVTVLVSVAGCVGKILCIGMRWEDSMYRDVSGCVEKVPGIGMCRESSKSVTDGSLRESSSEYIYTPFGNHCNHWRIGESCV